MGQLSIHRLHTCYHLPGGDAALRARFDRVRDGMLKEGLEAALDRLEVDVEEQVCLRRVSAPARLLVTDSDAALELDWSLALARAIRGKLAEENTAEIVRYPTRLRALTDFALGVARSDYRHIWAWRLIGLWPRASGITDDEAAGRLAEMLQSDGSAVIPVLCALAAATALRALDLRLRTEEWLVLAKAATAASGGDPGLIEIETDDSRVAPSLAARAQRAAQASVLRPLALGTAAADTPRRRAIAALVLLASEPAALLSSAPAPARLLAATVRSLWSETRQNEPSHPADAGTDSPTETRRDAKYASEIGTRRNQAASGPRPEVSRHAHASGPLAEPPGQEDRDFKSGAQRADVSPAPYDPAGSPAVDQGTTEPDTRSRGRSQWGGLLFLIWLVEECEIPRLAAEKLADRSLRSVLHRLGLSLLPLRAGDAAALAFAGLAPDAEPPTEAEPPTTLSEDEEIEKLAEMIRKALQRRLSAAGDALPLRQICARSAEIVADPGWIEVHLSINEVSTQLRHCGLDLNPGYIPWLGVVMRFVYD